MRVLVTGAAGFVGAHLARRLRAEGHTLVLVDQDSGEFEGEPVRPIKLPDKVRAREILAEERPDALVHLAGISSVPICEQQPDLARSVNVVATSELAELWQRHGGEGPFLLVSSAVVYGPTPIDEQPVTESTPTRPAHHYGTTKLEAEQEVERHLPDGRSLIFRPFNHFGLGQSDAFVISSFAKQAAAISLGLQEARLAVGNIDVKRDFLHVSDVIDAYLVGLERGLSGKFVLASGRAVALGEVLNWLQKLSDVRFDVEVDPSRVRANDLPVLRGSSDRYRGESGWEPKVQLEEAVRELFQDWRRRLGTTA